jgi:hypothetical protein
MPNKISVEVIAAKILQIRDKKVMLDKDLALLYDVKPIALRQQVKRNRERFPEDFMFQLTNQEVKILVSQNVIPSRKSLGGYLPYVFTEQGVAMLSSVLRSKKAVLVNIQIMRAFVKLRKLLLSHKDLSVRLEELERKYIKHDKKIKTIFEAIKQLLQPKPVKEKRIIGFHTIR